MLSLSLSLTRWHATPVRGLLLLAAGQTTECLNQGQMSELFSVDVILRIQGRSHFNPTLSSGVCPWKMTRAMVVANCDMATFDTETRPLMHRVLSRTRGHGQRPTASEGIFGPILIIGMTDQQRRGLRRDE